EVGTGARMVHGVARARAPEPLPPGPHPPPHRQIPVRAMKGLRLCAHFKLVPAEWDDAPNDPKPYPTVDPTVSKRPVEIDTASGAHRDIAARAHDALSPTLRCFRTCHQPPPLSHHPLTAYRVADRNGPGFSKRPFTITS